MANRTTSIYEGRALLDLVSYARRGPGQRARLSPAEIEHISRTVQRVPEVMVKVSGGGTSPKAVVAHLKYIDRRGELEIETDEGEQLKGRGVEKDLVADWDLDIDAAESQSPYAGRPGRKASKVVHNVVLSMPAGTRPDRLLAAARNFAREQLALSHRYAMVLHTDQDHPHVHLVVKAVSERGVRLNIRKATLREWRSELARHLRELGVPANATERAVRGQVVTPKADGIYRAMRRGESTHMYERVQQAARDGLSRKVPNEPAKSTLLKTRHIVQQGWAGAAELLGEQGQHELASGIERFLGQMPAPRTEREILIERLMVRNQERVASKVR